MENCVSPFKPLRSFSNRNLKDINDYFVNQNDEIIGKTYLSVPSSIQGNPICFVLLGEV